MQEFLRHLQEGFKLPLQDPVIVFSLILFIILLSPIILKKLSIPSIIGLIISGVIIGPHGLNLLEHNSAIELFSKIGILYIMFIAGLELDLNDFKANKNKSLTFAFFTFAIPLAVGFPVVHYFLGYDFNAAFLTASMFATHTLVTYPIVSKFGVSKNQAVGITLGGTLLTDTAVLIILSVIVENSKGHLTSEFWIRLAISLAIFSAIMFFVIPRIAKWFFRKLESEKHSHYIFVLCVMFFAAFLAEISGIEDIIGAFIAGLALNSLIPSSSALMNRIEFLGNSLFIPFFLISVGMLVNVHVIMSGTGALIVAGTLTVVAIFGKWLAAFFTQHVFKYSGAQRQVIFGLSSAHAAATLAVILIGYNTILGQTTDGQPIRLLDDNILNGTVILILVTSIIASFATEKAAKKIMVESSDNNEELLTSSEITNERILLPISSTDHLERLLEFSIFIKDKKSTLPISILRVVSNNQEAEVNILKARTKLNEFIKQGSAMDTKVEIITTIEHNMASGVARVSRETMSDLLVLEWPEKRGLLEMLIGNKIENILNITDKTTFIGGFSRPLANHKRMVIIAPPLVEHENGFEEWVTKISQLAQELSVKIVFYGTKACEEHLVKVCEQRKIATKIFTFIPFEQNAWDDFFLISRDIKAEDLLVLISARRGDLSYFNFLEHLPTKLETYFPENNRMIVYPKQFEHDHKMDRFDDMNAEPIHKSLETIHKLQKGLGNIFGGQSGKAEK